LRRRRIAMELILLVAVPAVCLLFSTLYLILTDTFHLSPYLMLCLSGLLAVSACLLWGTNLCARMVRSGARIGMILVAGLLTGWSLLYLLQGTMSSVTGAEDVLSLLSLLPPALLPGVLYYCFSSAGKRPDEQKPDWISRVLMLVGAGFFVFVLICWLRGMPLAADAGFWLCILSCAGIAACQTVLLVQNASVRIIPAAVVLVLELGVFAAAAFGLFGLTFPLMAYAAPLLLFAFCECAIRSKLLPDGCLWPGLLERSTFPLQLMDADGVILYGSERAASIAPNHKAAILNNRYHVSQILDRDTQLSAAVVRGGFALQQKNLRDLHALQDTLESVNAELKQTMEILSRESEIEAKLQSMTKKNVFFAEQEKKIQEKTDRASLLLRCAAAASPEPGFRRAVVTRANLLVTYIQQLGLLIRAAKETDELPVYHLRNALEASAKAATAAGARCRVYHVAQGSFPADVILALYDLHELVLEDILSGDLKTLEIRLRNEQNGLRLILTVKDTTLEALKGRVEHIIAQTAAMGGQARFNVEGGDVSVFIEFIEGGAENA